MKTLLITALASLTLATAALADEVALKKAHQAGSLHTGQLDMVAYSTDLADGAHEVTATFRARTPSAEPQRIVMRLAETDSVQFSMPSDLRTIYTFAHSDQGVSISARPVSFELASQ